MQFMLAKGGWSVSFLEENCRTSLPRHFVFQSELKILDLARHGGAEFNLAGRQAIEHGISMGTLGALEVESPTGLQLCNNPSYCAQEKMDGERREIERLSGMQAIRGINRKGEYVEIPQTVRNSAETIMLNAFLIDGEEVGEKLFVFDLLKQNDEHMYEVPQRSRYERLRQLIPRSDENIKVVPTAFSSAEKLALFNEVKERGGEGIVFKLVAAPYQEGKSKYALKWKFKAQATMGVISVHKTKRSVQVAASTEEGFQVVGNVTIPVNKDVPVVGQLVEIQYLYFFAGGSLFQPTYKGPRPDKDEADAVSSLKLKVAHPDDETEEEAAA